MFKKVLSSVLLLALFGCSSQMAAKTETTADGRAVVYDESYVGEPVGDTLAERTAQQREIVKRQEEEIKKREREIEDLKRQQYHNQRQQRYSESTYVGE